MGLSSSVGNASSFLNGIQAKSVSFNDPCAEISGPQSAKPGLFSGEPASFFTGVVAGTDGHSLRRWNSGGGRAAWHCGFQDVSLEQISADQVVCGAGDLCRLLGAGRRGPPAVTPSAVSGWVLKLPCWRLIGCSRKMRGRLSLATQCLRISCMVLRFHERFLR